MNPDRTRKRALVCAPLPPEFDREGGSRRLHHFIGFLLTAGWDVTFICENAGGGSRYMHGLRQRGVATWVGFGKETEAVIAAGRFDIAILAFWHVARQRASLIRRLSPHTRIIVESVDLHWLRNARRAFGAEDGAPGQLDQAFGNQMIGEMNAYAESDGVFTVSEKEAQLIDDVLRRPGFARAVPDCESIDISPVGFEQRSGILFVGNFRHPPNVDAVDFLCSEIVPRIPDELLAEHPVQIVGNALDREVERRLGGHPWVRAVGWVPEIEPYLHAARVSVVPLRYGAGTKRKLLQAMMAGTPSVATGIGVEGLDFEAGEHVLVADDPAAFAESVVRLLEDELLWRRLAKAGRVRVLEGHGRDGVRSRFLEAIEVVLDRAPNRATETHEERDARHQREDEIERVQRAASRALPGGARVLVISRGDPELLEMKGRRASHFPQDEGGGWAGFHPRDAEDALQRLHALRSRHDFLLIPGSASWWLDHYTGFAEHLDQECSRIFYDDACAIYDLRPRRRRSTVRSEPCASDGAERETSVQRRRRAG